MGVLQYHAMGCDWRRIVKHDTRNVADPVVYSPATLTRFNNHKPIIAKMHVF